MKKDIEIAQENIMSPIKEIADKLSIPEEKMDYYGRYKAKLDLSLMEDLKDEKDAKLVLVTAINPTKAGEGKSTTTIALADGLNALGEKVLACLREPSLGPVFGLKGGAAGGGYAQVMPMEDINLHFTGDFHAITTANNLVAAVLDNHIYQGNELNIDPAKVVWKRCLDMNDRTLRDITIGQKKKTNGVEREDHFCITVATEIMAILCLAKDLKDFENKVKECIVAYTYDDQPVFVKDLKVEGALSVVMKEAIKPNLVQTLEHTPVLVHGGPFANIAHGCNSVIATKLGLKLGDIVITEAGFGADLGAEKFLNIKCRKADLKPNAIVVVATCRALKLHGGVLDTELNNENVEALKVGIANLEKHIDSMKKYNVPVCVCINRFAQDTEQELETLLNWCKENNHPVALCEGFLKGSEGSLELAKLVKELVKEESKFKVLYDENESIERKIEIISQEIYGAKDVEYSDQAKETIARFNELGFNHLPICMAKTPLSLSDDPKIQGCPKDFTIHVKDLSISNGAGFVVVYTGNIMTMPGLPKIPAALNMGVDEQGNSYGIF